ncbi:MAG: hypothetical protein ABII10_00845 [Candidatus Paceibacterota bacterium]
MTENQFVNQPPITRDSKISSRTNLPTFSTLVSIVAIILLIYAFFSGLTYQFYASLLFLFYGLINSMWISVVLLGIIQTLLMIPFRMVRIIKANSIKEFQQTVAKFKGTDQQGFILKKKFRQGNVTFLFYAVDFVMQLVSYVSIGRLFLTDFYAKAIEPSLLYGWVPYPNYPIRDTFFKIPYPTVTETKDLGWHILLIVWAILIIIQVIILIAKRAIRSQQGSKAERKIFNGRWGRYTTGYLLAFFLLSWILIRHFPVGLSFGIFSGDVSIPNRTFNTVTAVVTFTVLVYHGVSKIIRKGQLAEKMGIETKIIDAFQKEMFSDTLFTSGLIGLGAFFITNQIPSAFELSIFTLEIISLAAPFTIDRLVLKNMNVNKPDEVEEDLEGIENLADE